MSVSEEGRIGEIGQLDSPRSPLLIWGDAWDSFQFWRRRNFTGMQTVQTSSAPVLLWRRGGKLAAINLLQLAVLFPVQSTSTAYPFILQSWSRDWFALLLGYSP